MSSDDNSNDKTRTHVTLTSGTMVSHYRIIEKIGAGGMGEVYLAEDTKLHRKVALKFLPLHLCQDADCRARFKREAQAAAQLDHPNIVSVFEVGEFQGRPFFSMQHVEGQSLKEVIAVRSLLLERIVDIGIQICDGFQAAHEKGVTHREIKPSNILIDSHGRARIVDFGLASVMGLDHLTKTGSTLGTVGYMSPEQVRGEAVDHRTDLFSLGVVLYELITGHSPFKCDSEAATLHAITDTNPEPLARYRREVPAELQIIIDKALDKKITTRYQHADDMLTDLRRLTSKLDLKSGIRRPKLRIMVPPAVVLVLIVILASVYLYKRFEPRSPSVNSVAVLPFVDMSPQKDQEYFCDGMTEELINRLSNIQSLRVPARTSAFYFKGKTDDIPTIGNKLKVQTVLEGSVRKSGDELRVTAQLINVADGYHLWSETYDRKLADVFAIQDEISAAIAKALELRLSSGELQKLTEHGIENYSAYEYYLRASDQIWRFDQSALDSAFVNLQAAIDIMGDNAILYSGMAWACWQYANMGRGQEEYLARAKSYATKAMAIDSTLPMALDVLANLSIYENYPANWNHLFKYYRQALAGDSNYVPILGGLFYYLEDIGKSSEALTILERIEQLDPMDDARYRRRGIYYLYNCQQGLALEENQKAYLIETSNNLRLTYYTWALVSAGRADEARALLLQIPETINNSVRDVVHTFNLLLKYALLKDKDSALRLITPSLRQTCWRDMEWSYWVASRLSLAGAKDEALEWLENAVHRGFINYPFLQCDPFLDNIRGEEQFKKLLEWAKHEWENFEV